MAAHKSVFLGSKKGGGADKRREKNVLYFCFKKFVHYAGVNCGSICILIYMN